MFDLSGKRAPFTGALPAKAACLRKAKKGAGFAFRQRDHKNCNVALFGVYFYV